MDGIAGSSVGLKINKPNSSLLEPKAMSTVHEEGCQELDLEASNQGWSLVSDVSLGSYLLFYKYRKSPGVDLASTTWSKPEGPRSRTETEALFTKLTTLVSSSRQ